MEKGLILVGQQNFLSIHIVRDSKMVVQMAQKIIDVSPIYKISKSWHLEAQIAIVSHLLEIFKYTTTDHVFWAGNKVDDWLANQEVMNQHR